MGSKSANKNLGTSRLGGAGVGMGLKFSHSHGEENLDSIFWLVCSRVDLPDFCFLSLIDGRFREKSLGQPFHDCRDELDLPLYVCWHSHRPISQPAHAFHHPYPNLVGQLGAGAFSTFGGLLPLVASLLALPQKNLLQGLANLKSGKVFNTIPAFEFITLVMLTL